MNVRKNGLLIFGCGFAFILLIGAVVFLVQNQGAYREQVRALEQSQARLNQLNNRPPFPSAENVRLAGENLDVLKAKYTALQGELRREQIVAEKIEPARFAPMLEQIARGIRARADEAGIGLPEDPGLGFRDYAAGKLPPNDPAVLDRLVVQIKAIDHLVNLMLAAQVASINSIERDQFENRKTVEAEAPDPRSGRGVPSGRGAPSGRETPGPTVGGLPLPAQNPLYTVERFTIEVTGRESAIWEALNRLVRSPVLYTIVDLQLENPRTSVGKPVDLRGLLTTMATQARATMTQPGGGPGFTAPPPSFDQIPRENRVVAGRETVRARIVVDMIRLIDPDAVEEQP
jgi:hypothetical protein